MPEQAHIELDEREEREVEETRLPPTHVVFETIRQEGERELERSSLALLLSGFSAGLSMGFCLIAMGVLRSYLPDAPWRTLIVSAGYTTGFLIVVLGRQQLFTENTLTPVLDILVERNARALRALFRLWSLVLCANLAGCAVVALALAQAPVFREEMRQMFDAVAALEFGEPVLGVFWRAIFAGWLIALMVWLLPASQGGARPLVVAGVTYLVGVCGFAHVVAGSVNGLYAVFRGNVGFATYALHFALPTLVGNIVGGVLLVALLSFGQVVSDHVKPGPAVVE